MVYQIVISVLLVCAITFSYYDGEQSRRRNVHLRQMHRAPFGSWVFLAIVGQLVLFRMWQGDFSFLLPVLSANVAFYVIFRRVGRGEWRDAGVLIAILLAAVLLTLLAGVGSFLQARALAEYPELQPTWTEIIKQALTVSVVAPLAAIFLPRYL